MVFTFYTVSSDFLDKEKYIYIFGEKSLLWNKPQVGQTHGQHE